MPAEPAAPHPLPGRVVYHRGSLVKACALVVLALGSYFFLKPDTESNGEERPSAPAAAAVARASVASTTDSLGEVTVAGAGKALFLAANTVASIPPPDPLALKKGRKKEEQKQDRKAIDAFFDAQGPLPTFIIRFEPEEWEYLKKDPRRYAEGTLWELGNSTVWKDVAIKCKGSAGSFQGPDARPGLSISMNKYKRADRWHGFLKWHLNNGAQDNSFLNEQISCEMARKAGVPASRCAHALLKWQGRDLGLYVFKEAFDEDFLSHFYKDPDGDLYDGGFCRELDLNTEKDQGDPYDKANLKELIEASREGNQEKRWERLNKILDIDKFLAFTAIESITCHWDGYNFNRNNYRVYFDKTSGKAEFFLHGTDQTFGDVNATITRDPGSLVGQAVMSNPAWKKAYREHAEKIYNEVLKPIDWGARVTEVGEKVKASLAQANPQWAKDYEPRIAEARNRVTARIAAVAKQVGDAPKRYKFDGNGVVKLDGEGWQQQGTAAAMDNAGRDGKNCLHIRADGETAASWRKSVALDPGKYRFEVRVATTGVVGNKAPTGDGAGLRISGGTRTAPDAVNGDTGWQDIGFDVESPGGDVVLVAELRATKGEAWFDKDSFRLRQVK